MWYISSYVRTTNLSSSWTLHASGFVFCVLHVACGSGFTLLVCFRMTRVIFSPVIFFQLFNRWWVLLWNVFLSHCTSGIVSVAFFCFFFVSGKVFVLKRADQFSCITVSTVDLWKRWNRKNLSVRIRKENNMTHDFLTSSLSSRSVVSFSRSGYALKCVCVYY